MQNLDGHPLWLESITAIPSESFTEDFLQPEPFLGTDDYIKLCGTNHFYMDKDQMSGNYTKFFCHHAHCLGSLTWIKKSSLSRDHNCDQNYAKPN